MSGKCFLLAVHMNKCVGSAISLIGIFGYNYNICIM